MGRAKLGRHTYSKHHCDEQGPQPLPKTVGLICHSILSMGQRPSADQHIFRAAIRAFSATGFLYWQIDARM